MIDIRGFTKVLWRLQFLEYLRTLTLKFQKAKIKLNWDSQQGRVRTTSILVRAFWNFKVKVLKYPKNCSFQYTLIPNFWHTLLDVLYVSNQKLISFQPIAGQYTQRESIWIWLSLHVPQRIAKLLCFTHELKALSIYFCFHEIAGFSLHLFHETW